MAAIGSETAFEAAARASGASGGIQVDGCRTDGEAR
jgi:hypothetical protein